MAIRGRSIRFVKRLPQGELLLYAGVMGLESQRF